MASASSNADNGIRLILEEIRDLKREAAEDRKLAAEDRKQAALDRKQWSEDRRRSDERLARIEGKLDKSLAAVAGALKNLTVITGRLLEASKENSALLKANTAMLREVRDSVRSPRRNGHGGNGKH